jgi:hypothetical protein
MPKLVDDPGYHQGLIDALVVLEEESAIYRLAMADAATLRAATIGAIATDESMRAAFADWPEVAYNTGLTFIGNVLRRTGRLHLLKRLSRFPDGLDPDSFAAAFLATVEEEELERYRNPETPPPIPEEEADLAAPRPDV